MALDSGYFEVSKSVMTNGDRIRAKTDEELAKFISDIVILQKQMDLEKIGCNLTATQLEAIKHAWFCELYGWIREPCEVDNDTD